MKTLPGLQEIVGQLKPSGTPGVLPRCLLVCLIIYLLIYLEVIGPTVQEIMNGCLETAMVPDGIKLAFVHPLLKKPNLDPTVLTNCRHVSPTTELSE